MIDTSFQFQRLSRLGLLGIAAAGACLALAGLAEAGTNGRLGLVSQQYHARAAPTELGGPATSLIWKSQGFSRYHSGLFQYQFHSEISNPNKSTSRALVPQKLSRILSSTRVQNASSGDKRRLVQLGLALALLYVVFLVFWFWGTRKGRGRFEGATRF
jgi:hypothetical protein